MNLSNRDGAFMNMEIASGTYQFNVQYGKTKNIRCITSPIFKMNNHKYKIIYFPPGSKEVIGLTLAMKCGSERVSVSFTLGLLDKYGRPSTKACKTVGMHEIYLLFWDHCGFKHFMKRSELEADFVRDGCFTLVCSIRILNKSYKEMPKRFVNGIMPFSIDEHFVQLLDTKETADVRFEVEGEFITAHRLVLAARSRVFKAMLFGPSAESKTKTITIKEINAEVFKAMLHFIYTDSVPDMSDDNIPLVPMTQHLLVAADRYELDGLKMLCEVCLSRNITMDTAVSTLSLAVEFGLEDLKNKCLSFVSNTGHLVLLSVKPEYVQLMVRYPSLLEEISNGFTKFVTCNPFFTVLI